MLSHVIPQCLVTDRIPIKLQLPGKSRLIFKLNLNLERHWFEHWCPGYLKHALPSSEIHLAAAKSLEIIGHVTNCCKRPI